MKRIDAETEHTILRHHVVDGWPIGTIASMLNVHHDVVRRVLRQRGLSSPATVTRPREVDPFLGYIRATLSDYPKLHASRLHQMVAARGYQGSEGHFRRLISELRPRPTPEPFARLAMPPGEQAQMDWGHFGKMTVGQAERPLYAFVVTLSWSRMSWVQFFHDMQQCSFLTGHVDAFAFFGGVPRRVLYDNLKSACIERQGRAIRFNESLLEMASHYGFEPRVANPRRGNEKGRVERTIRYIRTSFFAARTFRDLSELNAQARGWCEEVAAARRWPQDDRTTVRAQFAQERSVLRPVPPNPYPAVMHVQARVGRTPYIRFDTNDYSLPCQHTRRTVTVVADPERVRIVVDGTEVAQHARSFDRHSVVEDPTHLEELKRYKAKARKGAGMHRLQRAVPATEVMLQRAAERGHNLGALTSGLLEQLDMVGAQALEWAVTRVNEQDRVGVGPVRLVLESRARSSGQKPQRPVPVRHAVARQVVVRAHDLTTYDQLDEEGAHD